MWNSSSTMYPWPNPTVGTHLSFKHLKRLPHLHIPMHIYIKYKQQTQIHYLCKLHPSWNKRSFYVTKEKLLRCWSLLFAHSVNNSIRRDPTVDVVSPFRTPGAFTPSSPHPRTPSDQHFEQNFQTVLPPRSVFSSS